jgi:signal transduction histidine kinase
LLDDDWRRHRRVLPGASTSPAASGPKRPCSPPTARKLAAEGLARTKGSFLANMSHEIRTPMNAVLGLSRMVLAGRTARAPARDQLGKVHEAAQALTRVLDDVLDYSKIEAGALRFRAAPLFNLS